MTLAALTPLIVPAGGVRGLAGGEGGPTMVETGLRKTYGPLALVALLGMRRGDDMARTSTARRFFGPPLIAVGLAILLEALLPDRRRRASRPGEDRVDDWLDAVAILSGRKARVSRRGGRVIAIMGGVDVKN